jgi:hypothetical protein
VTGTVELLVSWSSGKNSLAGTEAADEDEDMAGENLKEWEESLSSSFVFLDPLRPMSGSAVWNDRLIDDDDACKLGGLDCAICSCIVHDAVRVDCCSKQAYCAECILRWKSDNQGEADKATCPLCRRPLVTIEAAEDLRQRVGALQTRCLYDACVWRGPRHAWDAHVTAECTHSPPQEAATNKHVTRWILACAAQPVPRTLVRMWIACRQLGLVASETGVEAEAFCEHRLDALAVRSRVADFNVVLRYIDRYVDAAAHSVMAHRLFAFFVNECIAKADPASTSPEELHQHILSTAAQRFPMVTSCALA